MDEGDTTLANDNGDARLWPHVLNFLTTPAAQTGNGHRAGDAAAVDHVLILARQAANASGSRPLGRRSQHARLPGPTSRGPPSGRYPLAQQPPDDASTGNRLQRVDSREVELAHRHHPDTVAPSDDRDVEPAKVLWRGSQLRIDHIRPPAPALADTPSGSGQHKTTCAVHSNAATGSATRPRRGSVTGPVAWCHGEACHGEAGRRWRLRFEVSRASVRKRSTVAAAPPPTPTPTPTPTMMPVWPIINTTRSSEVRSERRSPRPWRD